MPARTIVCPDCGEAVPRGRLSCPACGALLAAVAGGGTRPAANLVRRMRPSGVRVDARGRAAPWRPSGARARTGERPERRPGRRSVGRCPRPGSRASPVRRGIARRPAAAAGPAALRGPRSRHARWPRARSARPSSRRCRAHGHRRRRRRRGAGGAARMGLRVRPATLAAIGRHAEPGRRSGGLDSPGARRPRRRRRPRPRPPATPAVERPPTRRSRHGSTEIARLCRGRRSRPDRRSGCCMPLVARASIGATGGVGLLRHVGPRRARATPRLRLGAGRACGLGRCRPGSRSGSASGLAGLVLGVFCLGLVWPYSLGPLGAGIGALVVAIGALVLTVAGITSAWRDRHAADERSV